VKVSIRKADLDADRESLIAVMARNLPRRTDDRTFDWLYHENPEGKASVWLANAMDCKTVIGAAAAFPRRMSIEGSDVTGWVLGDFCIDQQYRSLGPALQLQRACLEFTKSRAFCYDFPSASMAAIYERLGVAVTAKMLRLAKPLRIDRKLREWVNVPIAGRAIAALGNAVIKIAGNTAWRDPSLELAVHDGPYDSEFTNLGQTQGWVGTSIRRSADYLNWRYRNNPLLHHECITARRHGSLVGYLVFCQLGEAGILMDLFGENDRTVVKGLLGDVVRRLVARQVMTISVWLNEFHPWRGWYFEAGFRVRGSAPWVCVSSSSMASVLGAREAKWFLMQGDRDS
jgi:hypothetical protein